MIGGPLLPEDCNTREHDRSWVRVSRNDRCYTPTSVSTNEGIVMSPTFAGRDWFYDFREIGATLTHGLCRAESPFKAVTDGCRRGVSRGYRCARWDGFE
jgi:hypothetical protein